MFSGEVERDRWLTRAEADPLIAYCLAVLEEYGQRRYGLLRLRLATWVGAELDLGLQVLGAFSCFRDREIRGAADPLMRSNVQAVAVADVPGALAWACGAELDVEAGALVVDEFIALLAGWAVKATPSSTTMRPSAAV